MNGKQGSAAMTVDLWFESSSGSDRGSMVGERGRLRLWICGESAAVDVVGDLR